MGAFLRAICCGCMLVPSEKRFFGRVSGPLYIGLMLLFLSTPVGRADVVSDLEEIRDRCLWFSVGRAPNDADTVTLRHGLYAQSPFSPTNEIDLAASGFALAGLPAAVEIGLISSNDAKIIAFEAAEQTLDMVTKSAEASSVVEYGLYGYRGMLYHYCVWDEGAGEFHAAPGSEVSSIDTVLLLYGLLVCANYFGEPVMTNFVQASETIVWTDWLDQTPERMNQFHMNYTTDDGFTDYWDWRSDEITLICLMAAMSDTNLNIRDLWTAWTRDEVTYTSPGPDSSSYTCYASWNGDPFTDFYGLHFIDTARFGPDYLGVDWFDNNRTSYRGHVEYFRKEQDYLNYMTFSFIAGATNPIAEPKSYDDLEPGIRSDAPLHSLAGGLPFYSYDPASNEIAQALSSLVTESPSTNLFDWHGWPVSTVNATDPAHDPINHNIVGQDIGSIALSIDNFLTRRIQNIVLRDTRLRRVLDELWPPVTLVELILPRFVQGEQGPGGINTNRVPYAFRARVEDLLPASTYRYANRVVTGDDPWFHEGGGNMIFVETDGGDFVRTTSGPGFESGDLYSGHGEFTTDEEGVFEGWFGTEPSDDPRFTPGTTLYMRMLLNDGQGGETIEHRLTTTGGVSVLALDTTATDTSGGISTNVLSNPGFEEGDGLDAYDWTQWGGAERQGDAKYSGNYGMVLMGWTTVGGFYQDYAEAVAGAEYEFSIWGGRSWDWEDPGHTVEMFIELWRSEHVMIDSVMTTNLPGNTNEWNNYSISGTAPGDTAFVRVGVQFSGPEGGDGWFRWDDAELIETRPDIVVPPASALVGYSHAGPRQFVVLYDEETGSDRPVAAAFVEVSGAEADDRYADFYVDEVWDRAGRWGTIIPNDFATGVRRVEERSLLDGSLEQVVYENEEGWPGTVNPEGGLTPVLMNAPPLIHPVQDVTLGPGSLLVLPLSAEDPDVPDQELTFGLVSGPADASVTTTDPAIGVGQFQWRPGDEKALTTNEITVRVMDNGAPELSDQTQFVVHVRGLDELFQADLEFDHAGPYFTIRWSSEIGRTYRVQHTTALTGGVWNTLGSDVVATGSWSSKTNEMEAIHRVYRVLHVLD